MSSFDAPDYSPYDPAVLDPYVVTPALDDVILAAISQSNLRLRVCVPCSVLAVTACQQVDVQPTLKVRYAAATEAVDMPAVSNVPVCFPMGQNYRIKVPIAVGDLGLLIFADRSLDKWKDLSSAQTVSPDDVRAHQLTDAVFVPGLVPFAMQTKDKTTDLVITAGTAETRVQQDGKFTMAGTGNDGQELLDLINQLTSSVSDLLKLLSGPDTMTLTMAGPQPFLISTQTMLLDQKVVVDKIKSNLETITGKVP